MPRQVDEKGESFPLAEKLRGVQRGVANSWIIFFARICMQEELNPSLTAVTMDNA